MEGNYPERKAAGFGHDPETTFVRGIMVKKRIIASEISRWMRYGKSCASVISNICLVDENMRVIGIVALRDLAAGEQNASDEIMEAQELIKARTTELKAENRE